MGVGQEMEPGRDMEGLSLSIDIVILSPHFPSLFKIGCSYVPRSV